LNSDHLNHPPFVFEMNKFEAGELKAIGYKNKKKVAQESIFTAVKPVKLKLSYDKSGKELKADGTDVVFVYATVCDKVGNPVTDSNAIIQFNIKNGGKLIGQNPVKAEAGIATILLQANDKPQKICITANGEGLISTELVIQSKE